MFNYRTIESSDTKPTHLFLFIVAQVVTFVVGFLWMQSSFGQVGIVSMCAVCVVWIVAMAGFGGFKQRETAQV